MINIAEMEQRVKVLNESVKQSADQHHILVGQAREAEAVVAYMKSKAEEAAKDLAKTEVETTEKTPEAAQ